MARAGLLAPEALLRSGVPQEEVGNRFGLRQCGEVAPRDEFEREVEALPGDPALELGGEEAVARPRRKARGRR